MGHTLALMGSVWRGRWRGTCRSRAALMCDGPHARADGECAAGQVAGNLSKLAAKRKDIFGTDEEVFGEPKPKDKNDKDAAKVRPKLSGRPGARPGGGGEQGAGREGQGPREGPPKPKKDPSVCIFGHIGPREGPPQVFMSWGTHQWYP